MRKIIISQIITGKGRTSYSGLSDENGIPVVVELEKDNSGAVLTIRRTRDLTEDEKNQICEMHEDCSFCPVSDCCQEDDTDE